MTKIITSPGIKHKGNQEDHVMKVMFDDNEPPKNYIWAHPDGTWKIWRGGAWKTLRFGPQEQDLSNYITKDVLSEKLNTLKTDILTFVIKSIQNISGGSDEALQRYITEVLEPKLNSLINIDHSKFVTNTDLEEYATKEDVTNQIQEVTNEELENRVTKLEGNLDNYVTLSELNNNYYKKGVIINQYVNKDNLESEVENAGFLKADANTISNINNSISTISSRVNILENKPDNDTIYDDSELRYNISNVQRNLTDNIESTNIVLSDIQDRISILEAFPHVDYITTEDVPGKTENI